MLKPKGFWTTNVGGGGVGLLVHRNMASSHSMGASANLLVLLKAWGRQWEDISVGQYARSFKVI